MRLARAPAAALWLASSVSCVEVTAPPVESPDSADARPVASSLPVQFELPELHSGVVKSSEFLGRMTLVVFGATYDTASQAAVPIASAIVRRHQPRINGLLVVFEPAENRPLALAFASVLDVPFPVALADAETLQGRGAFPGLRHVPSFVLLDREGREVWRRYGLATIEVIEAAVRAHEGR